jgi:hypothetical protein
MSLPSSFHSYKAVRTRAAIMLGTPVSWLFLNFGNLFDWPGWSGRYLSELTRTDAGCAVIMRLLDILESGGTVPVLLIHRLELGRYPSLKLIDGRLHEVCLAIHEPIEFP